jgi:site-specific recombinase XerD
MSDSTEVVIYQPPDRTPAKRASKTKAPPAPAIITDAGGAAKFAWDEFFKAKIANDQTRKNYAHAVGKFLVWCNDPERRIPLIQISPGHVGDYLSSLELATPTKKLRLAALRKFFDVLVVRHVAILNRAASVQAERYAVVEGKTPAISAKHARRLLEYLDTSSLVGLRDRAIIAVLIYTAARVGAVAKLCIKSLKHDGTQYALRFSEKGGKSREIPVRHDLEQFLLEYLQEAEISEGPFFRTAVGRTKQLTTEAMSGIDICRMIKRRLKATGLPAQFSPHSFRVATVTNFLEQNVALEDVQYLAGHADPRTTRLYDRRRKKVTQNIVERISI